MTNFLKSLSNDLLERFELRSSKYFGGKKSLHQSVLTSRMEFKDMLSKSPRPEIFEVKKQTAKLELDDNSITQSELFFDVCLEIAETEAHIKSLNNYLVNLEKSRLDIFLEMKRLDKQESKGESSK